MQPRESDSHPIAGHVRLNDRDPIERVRATVGGEWRDLAGELFCGWVWQGRDGNYYGQRAQMVERGSNDDATGHKQRDLMAQRSKYTYRCRA